MRLEFVLIRIAENCNTGMAEVVGAPSHFPFELTNHARKNTSGQYSLAAIVDKAYRESFFSSYLHKFPDFTQDNWVYHRSGYTRYL